MVSWEHLFELFMQMIIRPQLKNPDHMTRFNLQRTQYNHICDILLQNKSGSLSDSVGYDWTGWSAKIRQSMTGGVPINFLKNPMLAHTMVYARSRGVLTTQQKIRFIKSIYEKNLVKYILREDYIGLPIITSISYLTSANRSHHVYHLAQYKKLIGIDFWNYSSIIEWGGGYGNMARIIRRMRPELSYIIIDLPELLALQFVYLTSIFGVDAVNVVSTNAEIIEGKINLISSHSSKLSNLKCEGFLSTWALTESPENDQMEVLKTAFFNAKHILIASMNNENNFVRQHINYSDDQNNPVSIKHVLNVPTGFGIGDGNEYWFR